MTVLLEIDRLKKLFPVKRGLFSLREEQRFVHAVEEITFNIEDGEILGLVGESGCGKTTTAKLILKLLEPTAGTVRFRGSDIFRLDASQTMKLRPKIQMIFQDPFSSLNPRKTVRQILSKPFLLHTTLKIDEIKTKVQELLDVVGLGPPSLYADRYPHEFSGGQRQRIGIARAIALSPKLIIADEPVSALDMSVRAQILNLLKQLKKQLGLTYLLVTHDLAVVRSTCDRVAVMYLGKIVELAGASELYENPLHPYTKAILGASPIPNPRLVRSMSRTVLLGEVPSPIDPPSGCRFHPRCQQGRSQCDKEEPRLVDVGKSHLVACHLHL